MKNKNGFTLLELMAVIVIIALLAVFATNLYNRSINKNELELLIDETLIISEGAKTKYQDERMNKYFVDDLYFGTVDGKVCYNIEESLKNMYINKYDSKYKGSVEVCYDYDCEYGAKIWLTNGSYYINGLEVGKIKRNDIIKRQTSKNFSQCGNTEIALNTEIDFKYTGTVRTFIAPKAGVYKLEAWGAQGGTNLYHSKSGGYGGYSYGELYLKQGQKVFVTVGGRGNDTNGENGHAGYNGGGASTPAQKSTDIRKQGSGGGGGATHIAFTNGILPELNNKTDYIVMVAGGGAGATYTGIPGSGGGFNGGADSDGIVRATQSSGYAIGLATSSRINGCGCNTAGGGGGYYGATDGDRCEVYSGGGGSGFINYPKLRNAYMYGYNVPESTDAGIKTTSTTNVSEDPTPKYAKIGDGFARITYIGDYTS
jgi:prepilin-type N-terminal cleavage/methylation domain-containing protein